MALPPPPPPLPRPSGVRQVTRPGHAQLPSEVILERILAEPASQAELERWHQVHDDAELAGVDEDECCRRADDDLAAARKKGADEQCRRVGLPEPSGVVIGPGGATLNTVIATSQFPQPKMVEIGKSEPERKKPSSGAWVLLRDPSTPIQVHAGPYEVIDTPNFLEVFLTPEDLDRAAREKQFGEKVLAHNDVVDVRLPNGRVVAGHLALVSIEHDGNGREVAHFTLLATT